MRTHGTEVTPLWERHPAMPAESMQWTTVGSCIVDDRILVIGKRGTVGYNCNVMVYDMQDWFEIDTAGQGPSWDCIYSVVTAIDTRQVAVTWSIASGFYLSILTLDSLTWGTVRISHNGESLKGYSLSYCGHPSLLILFGGTSPDDVDEHQSHPRLLSIDGTTGLVMSCSQRGSNRPKLRAFHAASPAPKKTLVIHGGKDLSNTTLSDLWVYDTNTFYWREIICSVPLCRHSLGVSEDFIFIFGGLNEHNKISSELHLWDVASNTWMLTTPQEEVTPLYDPSVGRLSGCLGLFMIFGGRSLYGQEFRPYFVTIPETIRHKALIQELQSACTRRHQKLDSLQYEHEKHLSQIQERRHHLDNDINLIDEERSQLQQLADDVDSQAYNQRVLLRSSNKEREVSRSLKIKSWKINQFQRYERMTQQFQSTSREGNHRTHLGVMSPNPPHDSSMTNQNENKKQIDSTLGLTEEDKSDINNARKRAYVNAVKMFESEPHVP